ncbi:MAG: hypothetical protein ACK6A7_21695, partial [Planctomycetota bacterium]
IAIVQTGCVVSEAAVELDSVVTDASGSEEGSEEKTGPTNAATTRDAVPRAASQPYPPQREEQQGNVEFDMVDAFRGRSIMRNQLVRRL